VYTLCAVNTIGLLPFHIVKKSERRRKKRKGEKKRREETPPISTSAHALTPHILPPSAAGFQCLRSGRLAVNALGMSLLPGPRDQLSLLRRDGKAFYTQASRRSREVMHMPRGRPAICPVCKSVRSTSKGTRVTKSLGKRRIRRCRDCGRKFTPRNQKPTIEKPAGQKPAMDKTPPASVVSSRG